MDYIKCGICGYSLIKVDEDNEMKLYRCSTPTCQALMQGTDEEQDTYGNHCQAVEEKNE